MRTRNVLSTPCSLWVSKPHAKWNLDPAGPTVVLTDSTIALETAARLKPSSRGFRNIVREKGPAIEELQSGEVCVEPRGIHGV